MFRFQTDLFCGTQARIGFEKCVAAWPFFFRISRLFRVWNSEHNVQTNSCNLLFENADFFEFAVMFLSKFERLT